MVNRAPTVERDDDDDNNDGPLFFKDGRPVKFCFHESVTQGRGQITRDVERHGGQIVRKERHANVLLVDEEQDIALIRRRYYHSNDVHRLSTYVEPRGFVQACIRARAYHHVEPLKARMPGRAPNRGKREYVRVPFTDEDRDRLAQYIATRFPTRDGRMGNSAYKDLVRLGETDDPLWTWARRHTFHSWREHYKMNSQTMDERVDYHLKRLKNVGHHLGHDARRHGRRVESGDDDDDEEEEEEEEEEEGEEEAAERQVEQERPGVARRRARDRLARNEQNLAAHKKEEEESDGMQEEGEEEDAMQDLQRHKRHAQHRRDVQHAKRPRVSETPEDDRSSPSVEAGTSESSPVPKNESDYEEIEGSDLFGDRTYGDEPYFEPDDLHEFDFPMPFTPRASSVPEQDGAPLSTQATLVVSPRAADKEPTSVPGHTPTKVIEQTVSASQPTAPPSSQPTLVMTQERIVVQRARVRGASAQPGPSVPKETRTRGGIVAAEAPLQNMRARSRSVDVQPAPESRRARQAREKGKEKEKEEVLVSTEEDVVVEESMPGEVYVENDVGRVSVTNMLSTRSTFDDEEAVEGLLETGVGGEEEEEDGGSVGDEDEEDVVDDDGNVIPGLPRYQVVEVDIPTDSDDAETHGSLVRGVVPEGSVGGDDSGRNEETNDQEGDRGQDQEQAQTQDRNEAQESDEDDANADADRIERMARGSLRAGPASFEPRITRSMAATQARRASPRRTRSRSQLRQGTKVHVLPVRNEAAKAVKGRRKRT